MSKIQNLNKQMNGSGKSDEHVIPVSGMYKEYFLDYASYVILERAVPAIMDGLKPVQRRILHSMKLLDDGRFHKVANIIGHTMQFHPHGDAAIGDALVHLGQKNLLIECQGNWGDIRTGDSAAAPRYIEARLTKFALEVAFNPQTTEWQKSYDGRNLEPIHLPVKFPLLLAHGVEGIAVGLSTKIMPHNFGELIQASIKILQGKKVKLYPDFENGGQVDISEYNGGKRGSKIKVRATIKKINKNTLAITELPYGVTTGTLIESIIKSNEKGQIKIRKLVDNTAKDVEILIDLMPGSSPEVTIDALYAFTNCEVSISPNACVIIDQKPHFLKVDEILEISTFHTRDLLKRELEIKKHELEEKWHLASLEKIFIEERIYRDIEECESWESVLEVIDEGLRKYVVCPSDKVAANDQRLRLHREITEDDLIKLTEIRIKRISKYNTFKTEERIVQVVDELDQVIYNLEHLTEFAIAYFENLYDKYAKGRERKTGITTFDAIKATQVVAQNTKLYVNRKEGFIGTGLKKDEFVTDCSDIDEIIAFTRDGNFMVMKIADKVFTGKDIIHVDVWKKEDERTTYNMIYVDGKSGKVRAKRFHVKAITRDKEYDLTKGSKGSRVLYFTANPNGETETVKFQLSPGCAAKKKVFDYDFKELSIKGRTAHGNIITKYPVRKITQLSLGKSSLGAMKIWIDKVSGRINKNKRGAYLGEFDTGEKLLVLYKNGTYEMRELEIGFKFEADKLLEVSKFNEDSIISAIYFEGDKNWTMVKRFQIETSTLDQKFKFISESGGSKLYFATASEEPVVTYSYREGKQKHEKTLNLEEFVEVKGWKALGNKLGEFKLMSVKKTEQEETTEKVTNPEQVEEPEQNGKAQSKPDPGPKPSEGGKKLGPGDIIEFDF